MKPISLSAESRSSQVRRRKGRYYEPPVVIKEVAGLAREEVGNTSVFIGSAEEIAEAGLLPRWMLPGQPGQPSTSVALRPTGERSEEWIHFEPGYMQVFRRPNGQFRIVLNVDREERSKRQAARDQRKRDAEAAGAALLAELPDSLVSYCREAMRVSGGRHSVERWFNNAEWVAKAGFTSKAREQVLGALQVFGLVEIEQRLAESPMDQARLFIQRIATRSSS